MTLIFFTTHVLHSTSLLRISCHLQQPAGSILLQKRFSGCLKLLLRSTKTFRFSTKLIFSPLLFVAKCFESCFKLCLEGGGGGVMVVLDRLLQWQHQYKPRKIFKQCMYNHKRFPRLIDSCIDRSIDRQMIMEVRRRWAWFLLYGNWTNASLALLEATTKGNSLIQPSFYVVVLFNGIQVIQGLGHSCPHLTSSFLSLNG